MEFYLSMDWTQEDTTFTILMAIIAMKIQSPLALCMPSASINATTQNVLMHGLIYLLKKRMKTLYLESISLSYEEERNLNSYPLRLINMNILKMTLQKKKWT